MERVLKLDTEICDLAKIFTYAHNFIYLGRGYNYPVALEGALKLKEISYIHAEGYPAAEMKHGPIALIDSEMPVVAIATADSVYEKTISNIQEIKARPVSYTHLKASCTAVQRSQWLVCLMYSISCTSTSVSVSLWKV